MHPSSITAAQRMRAAHLAAQAAQSDASDTALSIAASIYGMPQLHDADVIVILGALGFAVDRSHGHIKRWADLAVDLTDWALHFFEPARAEEITRVIHSGRGGGKSWTDCSAIRAAIAKAAGEAT